MSPEKQSRFLLSANQPAPLHAILDPVVSAVASPKTRGQRSPLRAELVAQIQPFAHIAPHNHPRINTSKNFAISCNSLIPKPFNPTRINTSGNKDLKSIRISPSGSKDLKSFRINTSKKHGGGVGPPVFGANSILGSRHSRP